MSRARRFLVCWLILLAAAVPVAARATTQPYLGGRLAYISGGKLYVAGSPNARLVSGPGSAMRPAFSHDGHWLAFMRQPQRGNATLWLARADGSAAHRVVSIAGVGTFQWSPSADVLAVQPMAPAGELPVALVSVHGTVRFLPGRLVGPFSWSPDGRALAIAGRSAGGPTRLFVVRNNHTRAFSLPGIGPRGLVFLAGWWPASHGILYWIDPGACDSCIADGTKLLAYDLRTGAVRQLGVSLTYPDWVTPSGNRLLVVKGGDRSAFYAKHLQLCRVSGPCTLLPGGRPNQISVDPAWGPNGGSMAFVVAPAWKTSGWESAGRYRAWLGAHVLWTAQPDGSGAHPAGAGVPRGVQDPEWTRDGRGILLVKDGALWLDPHLGAANAHPIARLAAAGSLPNLQNPAYQGWYYGHMDWHELFAWY